MGTYPYKESSFTNANINFLMIVGWNSLKSLILGTLFVSVLPNFEVL